MVGQAKPGAVVVMKRGAQGASAWVGGEAFHVPAPVVEVVDTTGAGDAFNAGYLSARLAGASVEAALEDGVELASMAIASSPRQYRQPQRAVAPGIVVGAGASQRIARRQEQMAWLRDNTRDSIWTARSFWSPAPRAASAAPARWAAPDRAPT